MCVSAACVCGVRAFVRCVCGVSVREVDEALADSLPLRASGEGEPAGEPAVEGGGEVDDGEVAGVASGLTGGSVTDADTERIRERRESFCFTISVSAAMHHKD